MSLSSTKCSQTLLNWYNYMATSKPKYSEIVKAEKTLTKDAEAILKEAIAEYKKTFLASV